MKIEIKERKLTEGKRALYLEYYETGFRKRETCTSISCPMMPLVLQSTIGLHTTRLWRYEQSASSPLLYWRKRMPKAKNKATA